MHLVNLVILNFYFDLVPSFSFLKWNRYFSACENMLSYSCLFWKHKLVSLQIWINTSCHQRQLLWTFLAQKLYTLVKNSPLKWKFLRLSSARVKLHQISYVNFETTSQFIFKFFIILQCHYAKPLCNFLAYVFSTLDKRVTPKSKFRHF